MEELNNSDVTPTVATAITDSVNPVEAGSSGSWWRYCIDHVWQFVLASLTVIAGVIAIIQFAVWVQSTPRILLSVVDKQCLTQEKHTPDLVGTYTYKGSVVNDLWSIKVRLENKCKRNIIGNKDIDLMGEEIKFHLRDGYSIVAFEIEENQFSASFSVKTNTVSFIFGKWKPHQMCSVRLYCSSCDLSSNDTYPVIDADVEQLQQGELIIEKFTDGSMGAFAYPGGIAFLPNSAAFTLMWMGRVGFALAGILSVGFIVYLPWITAFKRWRWEQLYGRIVEAAGAKRSASQSWDFRKDLAQVPAEFWSEMQVPEPPKSMKYVASWTYKRGYLLTYGAIACLVAALSFVGFMAVIL